MRERGWGRDVWPWADESEAQVRNWRTTPLRTAAQAGILLAVGLLALIPRLTDLDRPLTIDEPVWFERSSRFGAALAAGDWGGTFQTGHPGVTTMWLGVVGMGLERAAALDGASLNRYAQERWAAFLGARRAMALAASALILLIALLVGQLFGLGAAALAGALLALDPWLIAHGRILHLDGLLASLIAIVALACLRRWLQPGGRRYVVLAGIAAGLALITKSAALVLLPALLLLLAVPAGVRIGWRRWLADLALLTGVAGATAVVAWPALLVVPVSTVTQVLQFGSEVASQPHENGSFFLGQQVGDPGLAFYPVVLAFRLSPLVIAGLLVWLITRARHQGGQPLSRDASFWLLLAAALVILLMGMVAKKQDRYVLPAVPLLVIVAAVGSQQALAGWRAPHATGRVGSSWRGRPSLQAIGIGVLGAAQLALSASARPYFFDYYSPLAGGPVAARWAIPVGWGEGLDLVGAYINSQRGRDAPRVGAAGPVRIPLRPQVRGRVVDPAAGGPMDYLVTYVSAEQRGLDSPTGTERLAATVRIDGITYAEVLRVS